VYDKGDEDYPNCARCGESGPWNEGADRDNDFVLCNPCAQSVAVEAWLRRGQPSECQDPTSVRVASIVAYLHRVAEQQDGYAKNSEGARWHPGERPEGGYVYTKRLRERAFMARSLAKRIARGDDLLTGPGGPESEPRIHGGWACP
jgi:hypothetical protein